MALNRAKVLETADKLVRQGKLEDAIKHYLVLSEDNPRDVNTINRIGDLYVRLRKNREGIRQFMRIADFYAGDGFHLKAIAMYKKITKLEPTHVEANERLAEMYARQGLASEARTQYLGLAEHCLKSAQKAKALEIYEKVQALEPENVKIQLIIAEIHARDGEPAKAFDGLMSVVGILKKRGMPEEALKVLQKASRLQPSHPEALAQMAELLHATGKSPKEVVGTLESLYAGNPANQRFLQLLGEAYLGAGRLSEFQKLAASAAPGEARICLGETEARFLASRQEMEKASQKLKTLAQDAGKEIGPERAASLLEQALTLTPEKSDILEMLLEVWTAASNREGMVAALERLGQMEALRENWEQAGHFLDRLQDLSPESSTVQELREKVEKHRPSKAAQFSPTAEPDPSVPSLDELERAVSLETIDGENSLAIEELTIPGEEEPTDDFGGETLTDPVEMVNDEESIREQEQAYSGKSVIQEMRGDPALPEMDEDFLNEHFTEAEVFLKYGLVEKAREQLQAILDRYPQHLPSLAKMKEVYTEEGRKSDAAALCSKLAELYREKGEEEKATEWEEQAKELNPGARGDKVASRVASGPSHTSVLDELEVGAGLPLSDLELDLEVGQSEETTPRKPKEPAAASSFLGEEPEEELSIELVDETSCEGPDELKIADRISQLEFSLQQGLREEAVGILQELQSAAPSHPEVVRLKAKLGEAVTRAASPSMPVTSGDLDMDVEMAFGTTVKDMGEPAAIAAPLPEEGFFDLAAELRAHAVDSTPDAMNDPLAGLSNKEEASIDEIFKAFRKKVDQQVEEEDYETRYNLGIAYKEMGLLDEAIGEFQYASRDPKLFLECSSILGICFREKGMSDLAVKWYRKALESTGHPEEKYQGLRYDLGELHMERGEHSQALSLFSEVYGVNSNYRDVASKIRELKKRVG